MPSNYEDVNHKILIKKDAKYSYRPIQLINPYLFIIKVILTDNEKQINKNINL